MAVQWRKGFTRGWLVLSATWIVATFIMERPDEAYRSLHEPIRIKYGDSAFEFPADTSREVIVKAIDGWIAVENAAIVKMRRGADVKDFTDEELAHLVSMDGKRLKANEIRQQASTNKDLRGLVAFWLPDSFVAESGDNLAKAALDKRGTVFQIAADFLKMALLPPAAILVIGCVIGWVISGFRARPGT